MGRMTRKKAAEVAEQLHIDEDELLDLPASDLALAAAKGKSATPEPLDRPPLGEIAPNSAESKSQSDDGAQELRKSTRNKRGKKGAAAGGRMKENDLAASTATLPNNKETNEVLPDENDSAPSPASEKAAEDLMRTALPEVITDDTSMPATAPAPAVKLTRSQLRKLAETQAEPKSLVDGLGQAVDERDDMKEVVLQDIVVPVIETQDIMDDATKDDAAGLLDAPASPLPSAVPNVVSHLRLDTPAKRSTSNKENIEPDSMPSPQLSQYDLLEEAVVGAVTPPGQRVADPIEALDQLDDALENVNRDIPDVQASPAKRQSTKETTPPKKKAAPVVRTTKAAAARISMAHNKDATARAPALGRPRPSMALGRASSVRESSMTKPDSNGKRVTSTSSAKDEPDAEKKEVVIPHSKARPISMSFPTPPPPPKSTKAPTQSTFQLPGEAIAAKLKAQREARQAREAEEAKKPAFKARPVPATMNRPPPSVRQTNASKARESVMNGRDLSASLSSSRNLPPHKRANSVATTRPATTTIKPRLPSTSRPPPSSSSSKPSTTISSSSSATRPRPSTAMASISKPRGASTSTSTATTTGTRVVSTSSTSTAKGKEVFNRAANAKAAAEKEKGEREAAAKKARAEAAERSRALSREFAEKQRVKKAREVAAAKEKEMEKEAGGAVAVA